MDVGSNTEHRNKAGDTSLLLAAKECNTKVVDTLIQAGAQVEAKDNDGNTPLILAVVNDNTPLVNLLIKAGASLSARNNDGLTALHMSCMSCKLGLTNHLRTQALIDAGADLQVRDKDGNTPLLLAARLSDSFSLIATQLIDSGADVNARNLSDNTALALASYSGNVSLCCKLLRNGAIVDSTVSFFKCFQSALLSTPSERNKKLSQLVDAGVSIDERSTLGYTALHDAASFHMRDQVKWLLDHGANINTAGNNGRTPLHCAIKSVYEADLIVAVTKLLLAKGADVGAKSNDSLTPLEFAKRKKCHPVIPILEMAELAHQLIEIGGEGTKPTTVAIRFGGPPGAGKSTLAESLKVTRLRGFFRFESQADEGAANPQQRTKGINCQPFVDETSAQFSIFDLGGHGEFLATHQMFIEDGSVPVIDCVVVSALDDSLETNALKWCSLFASRNRPTSTPWPLLLIATRADKADDKHHKSVLGVFHKLKKMFGDYFRFTLDKPLFVDARKSWSELTVVLRCTLSELHSELVNHKDSPRQPAVCQRIADLMLMLRKEASAPVITRGKFIKFMKPHIGIKYEEQSELTAPALASLFDKALQFLSGYATLLAFRQERAQEYVVIDPQWLLCDIVGRLMAEWPLPGPYVNYENGYAQKADVIAALKTEHLSGEPTLAMVASLGFCLEQEMLGQVLNPSKLLGVRPTEVWSSDQTMVVNSGRRLKCRGTVAIASAFFPHLQVHFYHRYLTDYDEELPMWNGGIRLVAGERTPAEALIEAHPAHTSIDIIVRGTIGSEQQCTDLLHELTEETLAKAVEISPGSQLSVFYLSRWELNRLSPNGLTSRPRVEYSADRVKHAVQNGSHVSDGKASRPEKPEDLLLSTQVLEHFAQLAASVPSPASGDAYTPVISKQDWMIVLLRLAKAVNNFDECSRLAKGLGVNDREGDIVQQLCAVNPHRRPPEVAFEIFNAWLCSGEGQTTELRRSTLHCVFRGHLHRPRLCVFLDDELRALQ